MKTDRASAQRVEPNDGAWDWRCSTLLWGMASALLMWAAIPPLDLGWLGWIAPLPWLLLIRKQALARSNAQLPAPSLADSRDQAPQSRLARILRAPFQTGRRPYLALWWAGFAFWLLALHWLRHPHPLTSIGWLALAFYLAFYVPVFVGLSRIAVHRLQVPLALAAPVVWTGLELARAHLLTGFLMTALGHTQYPWIELIQISDLAGAYAVSFLVMFVAACLARMLPFEGRRATAWPMAPLAAALLATLWYGHWRTAQPASRPGPNVALIQGSIIPEWKHDPEFEKQIFSEYYRLSAEAVAKSQAPLDLIIWPETMFRHTLYKLADDYRGTRKELEIFADHDKVVTSDLRTLVERLRTPVLVGIDAVDVASDKSRRWYNSCVFTDRQGKIIGRYDKIHRVMFGEYIPLAEGLPMLYKLTPLTGGIMPGAGGLSVEVAGARFSPNICFETVMPQVIRRQVVELRAAGNEPDVLVNLTNDAWFRGSSELDMHLVCGVFRAVECRKPLVISANGGISASIDSDGRIEHRLPRLTAGFLISQVRLDDRNSLYLTIGDWPAGVCLALCIVFGLVGTIDVVRQRVAARKR